MAVTVAANARTLVHAASQGLTIAFPDVCKTPAALGAPLPYPNLARSADVAKTSKRTTADGKPVALKRSELSTSCGDEAGSTGGVLSGSIKGKAHPVSASGDVRIEGDGVLRAFDLLLHNNRNTPPFPILQPPLLALPVRARPTCLVCGKATDPSAAGKHVPAGALDQVHDQQVQRGDTEGGACLWAHRPGWEETSCCHRWQAERAVRNGLSADYGPMPPDAFRDRRNPCWHEVHHLIAPRLLHEAIDAACGEDGAKAEFCRSAMLHAGYNINHGRNLLALPLLPDDARRLALPRRLVLDAATVGIPAAIAGAWEGKNLYDEIIRFLLTPIMTALAASFRPEACAEPGPAPGAVAKLALETLSDLIRTIICVPNKALGLLR
jgi:hypothetical protein